MERLSEAQRTALLRDLCRDYPRLTHPRLAHDPQVIAWLRGLLIEPFVLGFVTGPTDALRTFLITAIGNSIPLIVPRKRICGLDVHRPDSFVPVPGVLYFRNPSDSAQVKRIILTQWNEIENSSADVFLFNGVWALLPEIRDNILRLAKRHIVMVADKFDSSFPGQGAARDVVVNRVCGDFRPNHQIGIRIEKGAAA